MGKDKWEGVNNAGNQHDHMPDHIFPFPDILVSNHQIIKSNAFYHRKRNTGSRNCAQRIAYPRFWWSEADREERNEEGAIRTIPFH